MESGTRVRRCVAVVSFLLAWPVFPACTDDGRTPTDGGDLHGEGDDAGRDDAVPPVDGGDADADADAEANADADADADGDADVPSPGCGDPVDLLPAWFTSFAPAAELYVSTSGDDGNDGTDPARALRTLGGVVARVTPGTRVNFAAGTYDCAAGYITSFRGTAAAPIVLRSADGPRRAVFDCGGTGSIMFDGFDFVVLDGFEVRNTGGHGVQLASGGVPPTVDAMSTDFVLVNSDVHDTALAGIKGGQVRRAFVVDNAFHAINVGRQMVEFVASDEVVIAGNEGYGSGAFDEVKGGAQGGIIYRNYVHDTDGGIYVGADCTGAEFLVHTDATYEARDLRVWDNLLINVAGEAFRIVSCLDCVVANNTFWNGGSPRAILRILPSGFADPGGSCEDHPTHNENLRIVNNVFAMLVPPTYGIAGLPDLVPGLAMTNNLWFCGVGCDAAAIGTDIPFAGESASRYSVDPGLAGPPADVSPAAGSPLLGAGTPVDFVPGNHAGSCWPGAPNIGAL